ncbi:helix-turn-helix domain-containing protein, partial [Pseudomonas sp. IT-P294]|uniref:helix-turn-helix domain-containing protein n=1 Tax=Pseudomonas sp. IT-P294 TaxID=3026454 RepID=UPI0039DFC756
LRGNAARDAPRPFRELERGASLEAFPRRAWERSVTAVAEQLGFSEPSAFQRAFKKWTGVTPGAYRAQEN